MPRGRTKLKIAGMCAEGPPSYSESETSETSKMFKEEALAKLRPQTTYCRHYSSIREIVDSETLRRRIDNYEDGAKVHIEYLHEVPAGTAQDPKSLWLRSIDAATGKVTLTNAEDDPWDTEALLQLPHGAKPVDPGSALLDIYVAMVIGDRSKTGTSVTRSPWTGPETTSVPP